MTDDLKLPECMRLLPVETMGVIKRLEWYARKRKSGSLTGRHRSPEKGSSVEFAEHRQYSPGDDPKNLDWKVMGKSDRQIIRQYVEETNLRATIAVDVSGSMDFTGDHAATINGQPLSKLNYAKHLAAAIAYLFIKQGDGAGLITFDKTIRSFIQSASRPSQIQRILEELYNAAPGEESELSSVLHSVAERIPGRGLVILISDFFDDPKNIVEALHHFDFRNHELVVIHLLAEEELTFPFKSFQRFQDLEGIEPLLKIDPQAVRNAYLEKLRTFIAQIDAACGRMRADYVSVNTSTPLETSLLSYLANRK
ncbi:DUF58 domain-containing protein [Luteolibacter algae]|uniref:DUF58 domain-containing protein n=1 Tax=Luteolibacter algae TaxID=454151 RepID=A0ABW5D6C3_9BACT